jgi:hypothetical protein
VLGIDNAKAARRHGGVFAQNRDRVGHVATMQNAADQAPDSGFGLRPIDRNSDPAHVAPPIFQAASLFRLG